MTPPEIIRKNVKAILKARGLKQADVAKAIKEDAQGFNGFLRGRLGWSEKKRIKLADWLNVEYHDLLNPHLLVGLDGDIGFSAEADTEFVESGKMDERQKKFCRFINHYYYNEFKGKGLGRIKEFAEFIGVSYGQASNMINSRRGSTEPIRRRIVEKLEANYDEVVGVVDAASAKVQTYQVVEIEHTKIIKRFRNKALAKAINERLLRLENIDPSALDKVMGYLEGMISGYQALSPFVERRKFDQPGKIPKTGNRRKHAG